MSRRRIVLGGFLLGVLAVVGYLFFPRSTPPAERLPLPPPTSIAPAQAPRFADFVGAETCAQCHQPQFEQWRASTHGRAGGEPGEVRVIAPFDGTPIRFRDAVVIPTRNAAGDFLFRVRWQELPEQVLRVDAVVGGGHMEGGGTQGFLSRADDGTLRFLPFDWARQQGVWFCNTGTRKDAGWLPITEELALADCGDWPPRRVLGDTPEFSNCQSCHASQLQVSYDDSARTYRTRLKSLAINCESCHGPGKEHVELARSGRIGERRDIGLRTLGTLDKDASIAVCLQCHSLKNGLQPGYLPGGDLEQFYSLTLPILGDRPYHPDGKTRTFAYQGGHRASDCYLNGSMTCVDCHSPHSQAYRDHTGKPLPGRFSDGQCTSCHASKADRPERHTFHPAASAGSRCVNCHMPYLQQPEVGSAIRYGRSDHTIPIPRPASEAAEGVQSACAQCHTDRSPAQLQRQIHTWYGELKPRQPLVEGLEAARSAQSLREVAELVLRPEDRFPLAQFAGISHVVENHLTPDMEELDPVARERLRALTRSGDLDVRALSLAALHLSQGEEPAMREWLAGQLRQLEAGEEPAIRRRWAMSLGALGDRYRGSGRVREAILAYQKALEITPGDPALLLAQGLAYAGAGDPRSAATLYRRALERDPANWLVQVNLGVALEQMGDSQGAMRAYRAAIERNPHQPLAYVNLGNQWLRRGAPAEAIEPYERAVQLDPGLARAHFYLARAYIMTGDYARARASVQQGLRFEPGDATAHQMLRDLESVLESRANRKPIADSR